MKNTYFIIMITVLLAASCRKEVPVTQPPIVDKSKPTLLWKRSLSEQNQTASSFYPVVYKDLVIFSCEYCEQPYPILKLDGKDGRTLDQWNAWSSVPEQFVNYEGNILINSELIVAPGVECASINLENMSTNWNIVKSNAGAVYQHLNRMQIHSNGTNVFWTARYNLNNAGTTSQACILKLHPKIMNMDTVFELTTPDGYRPWFDGLGFARLPNGDDVVIAKNRAWNPTLPWQTAGRLDVYAYNITADSLMWVAEGIEQNAAGILPIRTYQGKAIVPGHNYIHCFDIATGAKLWDYKTVETLTIGDVAVYKDKVYYKGDGNEELVCLNPTDGKRLFRKTNMGYPSARMVFYNDKIFYCADGALFVVNAQNGDLIYNAKGMSGEWGIGSAPVTCTPAIDTVNRRVFMNNSIHAFALQMAEDW